MKTALCARDMQRKIDFCGGKDCYAFHKEIIPRTPRQNNRKGLTFKILCLPHTKRGKIKARPRGLKVRGGAP